MVLRNHVDGEVNDDCSGIDDETPVWRGSMPFTMLYPLDAELMLA